MKRFLIFLFLFVLFFNLGYSLELRGLDRGLSKNFVLDDSKNVSIDLDGNGKFDSGDVLYVMEIVVGKRKFDSGADLDEDGKVTVKDAYGVMIELLNINMKKYNETNVSFNLSSLQGLDVSFLFDDEVVEVDTDKGIYYVVVDGGKIKKIEHDFDGKPTLRAKFDKKVVEEIEDSENQVQTGMEMLKNKRISFEGLTFKNKLKIIGINVGVKVYSMFKKIF